MGYCIAQTSLAHTYGNVTCFFTEFIKSLFPENYFKTIHISSTIAYRQFNIFQNTNKEFLRKSKPMLIIRPRIELNDQDTFLYNTFLTTRMDDNYMETSFTNLQPFVEDIERGNQIKFLLNRLKMFFDVTIVTETQMEQLNQAHFLKNRIRQEKPFFLRTCLESFIPREMMEIISKDVGIEMYDENGSVKEFLDYLNSISIYPISYKMKNSTGNDEFFRFYPVNIDTTISGLAIDDGNKRGMIADAHTISFTVSAEFNGAGLYYYFAQHPERIDDIMIGIDNEDHILPVFTINNLYTKRFAEGWNLYTSPMYKVEPDASSKKPDVMNIRTLFNNSIHRCIEYHKKHGISLSTFLQIDIMKDNTMLKRGIDYDIDLDNFELITKNINHYSTYRMIVFVNTFYINSLIKDLFDTDINK